MAWVNITALDGDTLTGGLYYTASDDRFAAKGPVRTFTIKRGTWVSIAVRAKVHKTDGELTMSVPMWHHPEI